MKKIIAFAVSLSMIIAASPVSAAGGHTIKAESYGKMNYDTGTFEYKNTKLTLPNNTSEASDTKYDLRDEGRVTGIKHQGGHEYCWAFSTMASLESNLITKGIANNSIDLSEQHLAMFSFNGKSTSTISKYAGADTCQSLYGTANLYVPAATLARGYGAVKESVVPYVLFGSVSNKYATEKYRTKSQYELTEVDYISAATTEKTLDKNAIATVKQLIKNNGAVVSKMYFPTFDQWKEIFGSSKPSELKTYYKDNYRRELEEYENHAITIIGWDDDFSDFKSEQQPPGPGAWIIKDSYGENMHGGGYFYMSYYNPCMTQFVSFQGQKKSGRQIYQYDGVGVGDWIMKKKGKVSGANVYTARTDVVLDQVMTFTPEANCTVNIRIYATKNGSKPTAGTKLVDKTYKQKYTGYKRVNLGRKVGIPKGAKFSVIVTTKTPAGKYYVPFEMHNMEDGTQSPAVVKSGQSYVYNNSKWSMISSKSKIKDGNETFRMYNALAKTYGQKAGKAVQKIKVKTKRTVKKGKKIKLKAKRIKGAGKLVYQTSNASKATVSKSGVVTAKKKGTVKITVYTLPTAKYKSAKKIVKIKIK